LKELDTGRSSNIYTGAAINIAEKISHEKPAAPREAELITIKKLSILLQV
jgi:hypothetical protein